MRDHRLIGVLERLDHLLVVLEHVPDPLVGVADVVEVDLQVDVGGEEDRLQVLEVAQHGALRADDLAEVDDLLLDVGDVADDLLRAPLEDLVLDRVELVADLAQHRKAVVEAVVDHPVEQEARALREELVAQLLLLAAAFEQVLDRLQRGVRDRDQEVGADEDVELARVQPADLPVEDREVQDDEQVAGVLVDLRALVAREDVLEVEGMEIELLLEPAGLERRGTLDVDPAQAGPLDGLDAGLALAGLSRRRELGAAAGGATWAWEGSASLLVSLVGSLTLIVLWTRVRDAQDRSRKRSRRTIPESGPAFAGPQRWYSRAHIPLHPEGWRDWPLEAPATTEGPRRTGERCQFQQATSLGDVSGVRSSDLCSHQAEVFFVDDDRKEHEEMAATSLRCKECATEYELEARYVCENCFGPLEVAYDHSRLDPAEARRKIQAGPAGIWRYADFLPFAERPRDPLQPGLTPLVRADRLAEQLGIGEVWIKNDAANPTHSFKDRVVAVALAKARELGYTNGRLRVDRQPRERGRRARRRRRPRVLRVRARRPRGAEAARDQRLRHPAGRRARHLRRRQPALHRARRDAPLGVRQRQPAPVLLRGLEDDRL